MNRLVVMSLVALLTMLASCGGRTTVYHHYEHTPVAGWDKNDTLTFTIGPIAESNVFSEEIGLRINGLYPFMSLCLVVDQVRTPGFIIRRDTLSCSLIDQRGNIKGQGISRYQYIFHLDDIHLNSNDSLRVSIHHNMKREILPGITDVGVRLCSY
jgi:gliding motility-associated lipoprotein GldH